jgi:hypothetical protein
MLTPRQWTLSKARADTRQACQSIKSAKERCAGCVLADPRMTEFNVLHGRRAPVLFHTSSIIIAWFLHPPLLYSLVLPFTVITAIINNKHPPT